jgi:hypothetical protein
MFHCHNLVHEDNDMMVAAGVGRVSVVDGITVFDAGGLRNDFVLNTLDQQDKYYTVSGVQDPAPVWTAANPRQKFEGNFGSPYSPQHTFAGRDDVLEHPGDVVQTYVAGQPNPTNVRSGMGDRARPLNNDITFTNGKLSGQYLCSEICKGYYSIFYPQSNTTAGIHQLSYRPGFEQTTVNPIRNNIWAVPFNPLEPATAHDFVRLTPDYASHPPCSCGP